MVLINNLNIIVLERFLASFWAAGTGKQNLAVI